MCKCSYQASQVLSLLCNFSCSNFELKPQKSLRILKLVKRLKFEGAWGELAAKTFFKGQSWAKSLRQTLDLISVFQ